MLLITLLWGSYLPSLTSATRNKRRKLTELSANSRKKQVGSRSLLDPDRWIYCWADGIYSSLRAEQTRLCALVVIGVNAWSEKYLPTIEDGVRESTQSWREVLLKMKSRGMNVPRLAIGDGAWASGRAGESTRRADTRCRMHKTMTY